MSGKSDAPALRLVVEPGPKLVPASAFDAERLDSFKIGRVLRFTPVEEADRKDIRRWWAILNRAVKDTKTPWRSATQASEAIKLALGIVEYGKTVSGQFMQWPKSLKELDDDELAEAIRDMAALIHKMTGVDPLDWRKEAADVGQDEHETSSGDDMASGEESGESVPVDPAQQEPASGGPAEGGANPGKAQTTSADAPPSNRWIQNLKAECVEKFLAVVSDKSVPDPKDRRGILEKTKNVWKDELKEHHDFVRACFETCDKVVKDEMTVAKAKTYLEGLLS